jgi:hypothetical protein
LSLEFNKIGDAGAEALAMLKEAPLLETLRLNLELNTIGDAGKAALATLKDAALKDVAVNL